jgi:hypothetical protein
MSIVIPRGGPVNAGAFMDSALLHGAVGAFYRSPAQMTKWERYSLAMTTLGLWFHPGLQIQAGTHEGTSAFDCTLRELGAVRAQPARSDEYDECLRRTDEWARTNVTVVKQSLASMQSDPSYAWWIEWSVEHAWDSHRRRHGGLIDSSIVEPLRMVLDLPSTTETQRLIADARNASYVDQWIRAGAANAPEEVVKAYLVSALLRGVVNQELRLREGSQYAFHPFRRAILPMGKVSGDSPVPPTARWLASMILNSAFELPNPLDRAICWARNLTQVRLAVIDSDHPLIFDPSLADDQAASQAAQIVKKLDLRMPSRTIGAAAEFAFGLFDVLGIVEGSTKFTGWRAPSEVVHDQLTRTRRHLTDLARHGPGQIVFLTGPVSLGAATSSPSIA